MTLEQSNSPNGISHSDLAAFQERLGIQFRDPGLLQMALTHASYINELVSPTTDDNQRLEFLGDAILDFVVGDWLFQRYPDAREGELTSIRADVVRTSGLAAFAREIGLGEHLRLGRGEHANGGGSRAGNLCAAFEALVGAIYLDQGIAVAQAWVIALIERHAQTIDGRRSSKDAKSQLQEIAQARHHITPTYRIVDAKGPDHAKVFTAEVLIGEQALGAGSGNSKQAAESAAARAALAELKPRRD